MILAVMPRTIERPGFGHQLLQLIEIRWGDLQGGSAVGSHVQVMPSRQLHFPEMGACEYGRIHQHGQGNRLKLDRSVSFTRYGERGTVFPSRGEAESGLEGDLIRIAAGRIEQHLVPA